MDWAYTFALFVGSVLFLGGFGMPVAFAFLTVNLVSAYIVMGGFFGVIQAVSNTSASIASFTLVPVPMFIIMGELFFRTGLAPRVFDALDLLFGRLPGRLSYLTVGGGTIFSALSGSSMANTAMMGSLLVPNMVERKYKSHMIMGPIMAAGGLAVLIPPSGLAVLLGSLANIDIGRLLIAGVVPGLMLAALYALVIYLQVRLDPGAAPSYEVQSIPLLRRLGIVALNILPMGLVVFAVIGMIVLGLATPTESSAFGVLSVLILAALYRKLTWAAIADTLMSSLKTTTMLLLIIMGSATFSQVLAFSGASSSMVNWATGFDAAPLTILFVMLVVLMVLGMFMDQISMLMLSLPVFLPVAAALQFDSIWFGMLVLLALEISLLTPPFGLLLFVMMGAAPPGSSLGTVIRAALPYLACQIALVLLIVAFPAIATWLPSTME